MRRKRLLSWVLTFSLLAGMLGVPVSADGETKTITPDNASSGVTMEITLVIPKKAPTAADFTYTAPSDLVYSGSAKTATVTSSAAGMGAITVKYYSDAACTTEATPVNVGTYYVGVTVAEGDQYAASTAVLYGDGWTFTITASTPDAPAAPTAASTTKNSVTLMAVSGCEYSKDSTNWQDGTEFTGLLPSTEYTLYQRLKATANTNASPASSASITTGADTYSLTITLTIPRPYVPSYSDDSGNDSSPATTITVPVSSDTESVSVSASVSGDTATVQKPSEAQMEQIIGESVQTGEVTIDVSGLNREITTVSIPTETVKAVEQAVNDTSNDATGLTVKLSDGSVTFDAQALTAITEQAKGSDLKLNLADIGENKLTSTQQTATKDMDVQAVYDAYMTSGGQRISDFKGGKATVTVPYELKADQRAAGVTVWYVADNGDKTEMPSTYDGKDVKFTVEHFSNYVIAYDAERAAVCPQDGTCPISKFTDADPTAWYHDGVHYVLENGIMSGYGNGLFGPGSTTSRAMMAQILWNMEGKPVVNYAMSYTDVNGGQWYTEAVRWATSEKIMSGYGNGVFGPNDAMTREQLVTIMYRYAQYKGVDVSIGEDTNILSYDDALTVSEFAIPAMQWAVGSGTVSGRTSKTLNPKDTATRAEIATIIMRYCTEITK